MRKVFRVSKFSPIFLLFLSLVITGCEKQVFLDNPSENTLLVSVAGKEYVVEPDTGMYVPLRTGVCTLAIALPDGTPQYEGEVDILGNGLLNLARVGYVIEDELYVDYQKNRTEFLGNLSQNRTIELHGQEIRGAFEYAPPTQIFIEKSWNFDPETKLPEQLSLAQFQSYDVKRKIWRAAEFWEDFQKRDTSQPPPAIDPGEPIDSLTPTETVTVNNDPVEKRDTLPQTETEQPDSAAAETEDTDTE